MSGGDECSAVVCGVASESVLGGVQWGCDGVEDCGHSGGIIVVGGGKLDDGKRSSVWSGVGCQKVEIEKSTFEASVEAFWPARDRVCLRG